MTRHTPEGAADTGKSARLLLNMGGCVGGLLGLGVALLLWPLPVAGAEDLTTVGLFALIAGLMMGTGFNLLVRHQLGSALRGTAAVAVLEAAAVAAAAGMFGLVALGFQVGALAVGAGALLCVLAARRATQAASHFQGLAG